MILVLLGTHPQPMDRVVRMADRMATDGERVIIQAAAYELQPTRAEGRGILDQTTLDALISEARAVVTHGGPGTIMGVLARGKVPFVIARRPDLGEHVDDHQIRFVTWLRHRHPIVAVDDLDQLPRLIRERSSRFVAAPAGAGAASVVARRLEEIVRAGTTKDERVGT